MDKRARHATVYAVTRVGYNLATKLTNLKSFKHIYVFIFTIQKNGNELTSAKIYQVLAHQAPLPMGFSRQEYWSGLPFPSTEELPDPGIKPRSPTLQGDSLSSEPPGKPQNLSSFVNLQIVIVFDNLLSLNHEKYFIILSFILTFNGCLCLTCP